MNIYKLRLYALCAAIAALAAAICMLLPAPPAPTAVAVAITQAEKNVNAAETKIAAATVRVKHIKAVVKTKAAISAENRRVYELVKVSAVGTPADVSGKRRAYEAAKAAEGDKSVAPTPEPSATVAAAPSIESVIDAADAALAASDAETATLQEETSSLETVIAAHEEKESALESERDIYKARVTDVEKENAQLKGKLFWTHVGIGVAVVIAAAGGLYLLGVF